MKLWHVIAAFAAWHLLMKPKAPADGGSSGDSGALLEFNVGEIIMVPEGRLRT
jgi:hypothetical protein